MSVLIKPLVTEKANFASEQKGKYTFIVKPKSNKVQIKQEIGKVYDVDVVSIQTMVYAPKVKKKFTKAGLQVGKSNKLKKAIVSLAEGQEIDIFSTDF